MNQVNVKKLTFSAIITALILLMGFTPLGYIKVGVIEITTMHIPVAIGAAVLGWRYGLFFGFMFGFTSLMQAFMGSPFGQTCLAMSTVYTIILCIIPRMLMGYLTGLIGDVLRCKFVNSVVRNTVLCIAAPLFNTVFFVAAFALMFGNHPDMVAAYGDIIHVITAFITLNAVVEVVACAIIGTAVCVALEESRLLEK